MKLSQFCSDKHANTSLGACSCSCSLINPLISRNSQHPEENFLKAKLQLHRILTWLLTLVQIQSCALKQQQNERKKTSLDVTEYYNAELKCGVYKGGLSEFNIS